MKKAIIGFLSVAATVAVLFGGYCFWMHRPWRVVLSVNNHGITARELDLRAQTLMDDAKRVENLVISGGREKEAFQHYRREAAKMWIIKEVLLSEAVAHNVTVSAEDEKEALAKITRRLKSRKLTAEEFFKEGPLSEELKRRDFREAMLIDKYTEAQVADKIVVTPAEAEERWNELRRQMLLTTKRGETPKFAADRKTAINMIRAERFRRGFRRLFREAFMKSNVKSSEFPDLENLDKVSPPREEDKVPENNSK